MPIPGAGHTVHNSLKDLASALTHYQEFFDQLKVVELALGHAGRNERIVAKCFEGTPFSVHKGIIEHFHWTLHEERWGAIADFCRNALVPVAILRRCWSQSQYEGRGEATILERAWNAKAGGRAFVPAELTELLRSPLFRHYHYMVVKLNLIPRYLMVWFDSCPCHQDILSTGKTSDKRARALRADGLDSLGCPCGSCRAWEVIDGRVDDLLRDIGQAFENDILQTVDIKNADGLTQPLNPADLSKVLTDYRGGLAHIQFALDLRLSWRRNLPWMLMGIPHPNPARGAHWARQCVTAFLEKTEAQHHRLSLLFLRPGSVLRVAIDQFILTFIMPPVLFQQVSPFLFVALSDRYIEREHKYLSDKARPKVGVRTGKAFSLKRFRTIEKTMSNDHEFRDRMVKHFMGMRTWKDIVQALGFDHHPHFIYLNSPGAVVSKGERGNKPWHVLEKLVYRMDVGMKYESFRVAKKHAEKADERRKKEVGRGAPKPVQLPTSFENLLLMNSQEHLHARGAEFSVIAMPQTVASLEMKSLQELLQREVAVAEENVQEGDVEQRAGAIVQADVEAPPEMVCFKVLKGNPVKGKSITTFVHQGGSVLSQTDFAVTLHNPVHDVGGGPELLDTLVVDMCPRVVSEVSQARVLVVQGFNPGDSLQTLVSSVKGWSSDKRTAALPLFQLPIQGDKKLVSDAISELFTRNAFEGLSASITVDVHSEPWARLLQLEYIQIVNSSEDPSSAPANPASPPRRRGRKSRPGVNNQKVQLADSALQQITTATIFKASQPVFEPRRTIPLLSLTSWELGMLLKDRGWQWQLLPLKKADRLGLVHETCNAVGTFFTLGKTILHAYAQCLLSCEELRNRYGTLCIPHHTRRPTSDYKLLLQGKPIPQLANRRVLMSLQNEFPDEVPVDAEAPQQIEDAREPSVASDADDQEQVLDKWLEEVIDMEDQALEEQIELGGEEEVEELDPGHESDIEVSNDEGTEQPPQKRKRGTATRLRKLKWGCFTIARKKISDVESAFECRCPFHMLNAGTGCKRTIHYSEETEEHCLMVAKWWCNQAKLYRKQVYHRGCFVDVLEVPYQPDCVLEEGKIIEAPDGHVKTDVDIDLEDAQLQRGMGRGGAQSSSQSQPARLFDAPMVQATDSSEMASRHSSSSSSE